MIEFNGKGSASIKDLNSLNGVYINEKRLKEGEIATLKQNDVIGIGPGWKNFLSEAYNLQERYTFLYGVSASEKNTISEFPTKKAQAYQLTPQKPLDEKISVSDIKGN